MKTICQCIEDEIRELNKRGNASEIARVIKMNPTTPGEC